MAAVQHNAANGSSTSPSVDIGSVPTAGDLVVVGLAVASNAATVTAPSGYTEISTGSSWSDLQLKFYYRIASGGAGTDVISASLSFSTGWSMVAAQYHASIGTWALDKSANALGSNSPGSSGPVNSGTTALTTQATEVWLAALSSRNSQSSPTNGFSLVDGGGTNPNRFVYLYDRETTSLGTANTSATQAVGTGLHWIGAIGTFYSADTSLIISAVPATTTLTFPVPVVKPLRPPHATMNLTAPAPRVKIPNFGVHATENLSAPTPVLKVTKVVGAANTAASMPSPTVNGELYIAAPPARVTLTMAASLVYPCNVPAVAAINNLSAPTPSLKVSVLPPAMTENLTAAASLSTVIVAPAAATTLTFPAPGNVRPGTVVAPPARVTASMPPPVPFASGLVPESLHHLVLVPVVEGP